jgi:hypothetical protein
LKITKHDERRHAKLLRERKRRRKRAQKAYLLTPDSLDKRSRAYQTYTHITTGIQGDLGGRDRLSTVELSLIDAYAGACIHLYDLNAKLLLGESIDLGDHAAAISAMVRVASRIGVQRRLHDVTPDLSEYLEAKAVE